MASHSYLGDDLEAVRSRNFLNEGDECEILLIPLRNIILFPGDTLPLRLRNKSYIRAIENLMKGTTKAFHGGLNSLHLGVVNLSDDRVKKGVVGTTSEIRGHRSHIMDSSRGGSSSRSSSNGSSRFNTGIDAATNETDEMVLTAKGCHRFQVLEDVKTLNGVLTARVLILGENIPRFHRELASTNPFPPWVSHYHFPAVIPIAGCIALYSVARCDANFT